MKDDGQKSVTQYIAGWDAPRPEHLTVSTSLEEVQRQHPEVFGGIVCDWFDFVNQLAEVNSEGNYHQFILLRITDNVVTNGNTGSVKKEPMVRWLTEYTEGGYKRKHPIAIEDVFGGASL